MNNITIIREMNAAPDMDLENRILKSVVVSSECLATDGAMILLKGLNTDMFRANPNVTAKHGSPQELTSSVIARALQLNVQGRFLVSEVQFAETELGKEYAYLYGLNEKQEVYMRGWSVDALIIASEAWTFDQAKSYLGNDWSNEMAEIVKKKQTQVNVVTRSVMKNFGAVEVGADRRALSRACAAGVKVAGEIISRIALAEAQGLIAELKAQLNTLKTQTENEFLRMELEALRKQTQALGSDGAAAAARGDTAELLNELQKLREIVKR